MRYPQLVDAGCAESLDALPTCPRSLTNRANGTARPLPRWGLPAHGAATAGGSTVAHCLAHGLIGGPAQARDLDARPGATRSRLACLGAPSWILAPCVAAHSLRSGRARRWLPQFCQAPNDPISRKAQRIQSRSSAAHPRGPAPRIRGAQPSAFGKPHILALPQERGECRFTHLIVLTRGV